MTARLPDPQRVPFAVRWAEMTDRERAALFDSRHADDPSDEAYGLAHLLDGLGSDPDPVRVAEWVDELDRIRIAITVAEEAIGVLRGERLLTALCLLLAGEQQQTVAVHAGVSAASVGIWSGSVEGRQAKPKRRRKVAPAPSRAAV